MARPIYRVSLRGLLLVFALNAKSDEKLEVSCSNHLVVNHPLLKKFPSLQRPVGIPNWERLVAQSEIIGPSDRFYVSRLLQAMNVQPKYNSDALDQIPSKGPLIIPVNHPSGIVDGLAVVDLIAKKRSDVKVVMTDAVTLKNHPEHFIYFDLKSGNTKANIASAREMREWVEQGHALVVFPAGKVSRIYTRRLIFRDPPWQKGFAKLALDTRAQVLPVFIGVKSPYPYMALRFPVFSPLVEPLLMREALKFTDKEFPIHVGRVMSPEFLAEKASAAKSQGENPYESIAAYVRNRIYTQGHYFEGKLKDRKYKVPVAQAEDRVALKQVFEGLKSAKPQSLLHSKSGYEVYAFTARDALSPRDFQIFLRELGRAREETFRLEGEGTGNPRDLDPFDNTYTHLVVWNSKESELVGAYRLGLSDKIMAEKGIEGFYTRDLFPFDKPFLDKYPNAIELGRSFVLPKYQKGRHGLFNLFTGIANFLKLNPQYRYLFGTVSLSGRYQDVSKYLVVEFLKAKFGPDAQDAKLVRAKHPANFPLKKLPEGARLLDHISSIAELDQVVQSSEPEGDALPTLFNAYLGFKAKFLEFGVDPDFTSLDGFIVVDLFDLANNNPDSLRLFFGGLEGVAQYAGDHLQKVSN
ncbi:MAG: lysophospholipid acyltransferase family protein [Proteobacteria bacterium]|nr:lysophospholipid acyltransferase family protein [Pseudomonadota bacterium]